MNDAPSLRESPKPRVSRLRRWLARCLDPEIEVIEHREWRLRADLDDARWWLGSEFPQAASVAQFVLQRSAPSTAPPTGERYAWSPPGYVWEIAGFRQWLRGEPFLPEARKDGSSLKPTPRDLDGGAT
jgi:hypothetical protein